MGDFPVAEQVLNKVMCLPMHYEVTKENVDYIADALVSSIKELSNEPQTFVKCPV